jgi:hypothetical protein
MDPIRAQPSPQAIQPPATSASGRSIRHGYGSVLPVEILCKIAEHLPPDLRAPMFLTAYWLWEETGYLRKSSVVTVRVSNATTLKEWSAALNAVKSVSQDLQAECLEACAYRVPALPDDEQEGTLDLVIAHAERLPLKFRTNALDAVVEAARGVPRPWTDRDRVLTAVSYRVECFIAHSTTVAKAAVREGDNVQVVVRRHALHPSWTLTLERIAVTEGAAAAAVDDGGKVQDVATRYGIHNQYYIDKLVERAVKGPAGVAVARGVHVQIVAERHGIPADKLDLHAADGVAGNAVSHGENVQVVAKRHGIGESGISILNARAVGPASAALARGDDRRVVAQRHGIPEDLLIRHLCALDGEAGAAVARGENVREVAKRHRIPKEWIFSLERLAVDGAAGDAVARGENAREVAKRHGIRESSNIKKLESKRQSAS